jgi:hypothetical protein
MKTSPAPKATTHRINTISVVAIIPLVIVLVAATSARRL